MSADLKSEIKENYRYASEYWAPYIQDTNVYTYAASGYTWSDKERAQLRREGREPIEFNIMRKPLSFFSGYLRDNANQVVYGPVEGSDQQTADDFTELGYNIWENGGGWTAFLDGYDEALKSGMSLIGVSMDYTRDFVLGDLKFWYRTYNQFYLDPTFTSIDLSDCGYAMMRDLLSVDAAKSVLSDIMSPKEVEQLSYGIKDNKYESYRPNLTSQYRKGSAMVAYDQYYRRTTRSRDFLVDPSSGHFIDIDDWDKEKREKLEFGLNRMDRARLELSHNGMDESQIPYVEIQSVDRPYIELHTQVNDEIVYSGEDKTGITEMFPFAPALCYFEPSILHMPSQRVQGLAAAQYFNQRQFNKRHMKIIDSMDSDISKGFLYLLGSVPDPDEFLQSGQNRIIGVDPDNAPAGLDSVREINGGGANPTLIQYQEILDKLSLTLGNVTPAAIGEDEKINTLVSGRLAQVQIGQSLMTNRKIFDNVESTQQVLGRIVLKGIQNTYTPEKVERILGRQPSEEFYDKSFDRYDAVIKEGVRSKSQRDAYYYELVNLKKDGIVDVPQSAIVKALSMTGVSDLEKAIEEQEQKAAEQQSKVDEQERVGLQLANSQAVSNLSLSAERQARVKSDLALAAERISESHENRSQAALARAKTLSEIADMETDRLLKVMEFVKSLEEAEIRDRERVGKQVEESAIDVRDEVLGMHSLLSQPPSQSAEQLPSDVGNALPLGGGQ